MIDHKISVESARAKYEEKVNVYRSMPKITSEQKRIRWAYFVEVVSPLGDAFEAAIKARDKAAPCLCGCPHN